MRSFIFFIMALVFFIPQSGYSAKPERYSSVVIVEATGEVLHARYADQLRHPASLSKVMTLYLLFRAIERGEVGLDDPLRVSTKATKAQPSKLGLKAATTISVENAIRALVTKSANDVAIVVAERLAGGEAKFAGQMTRTASLLGMSRSRFANGSGLPDKRQVSTAHDMAILAAAIRKDFPQFFHFFSLEKFIFNGRTYNTHNSLIGRIPGVDGLKTGYTHASGYNIAVTAKRDGVGIIAVVFGGSTATQRDSHAADLITTAYTELANRKLYLAAAKSMPTISDLRQMPVQAPAGLSEQVEQGSAGRRGVRIRIEGQDKAPPVLETPSNLPAQWLIQVGAYSKRSQAEARLAEVSNLLLPSLTKASPIIESSRRGEKNLFRARFSGFGQSSATRACISLTNRGQPCFPVASPLKSVINSGE